MAIETTAQDSVAQSPAPAKASAKKGAHKKRVSKKRAAKKRTSKKRTTKKSAAKKPVALKKSVAKKPTAKKSASKKRKPKKQAPSNGTTKAQSIRDTAKELGNKARPKDIIAALAAKGITVTSPQVSSTLKAAGLRRGRRRRQGVAAVAAKQHSRNGQGLDIHELVQVKKLAEQLGGTGQLKELAAALERLL